MTDKEILKALGLSKKSCISEQIVQTTHHWLDACEKISELEKENAELKEVHESDKRSLRLIAKKGADLEKKISVLLSCKNCPENKGGLLCQKEYEDKCLAQKIQYIKELEKENAELKEKLNNLASVAEERLANWQKCAKDIEVLTKDKDYFSDALDKQIEATYKLFEENKEAKEIIKKFSEFANLEVEYDPEHPQEHTDLWNELCKEAEQFLKECE